MSQKMSLSLSGVLAQASPHVAFFIFFNKTGKIKTESAFSSIPIVFHLVCKRYAKPGLHYVL